MSDTTTLDVAQLRAASKGTVLGPGDDGFDAARLAFNVTIDQRPAAVAFPSDSDDVVEVVRFARDHGHQVAPQRTGHNAAPLGSLENVVLLKTNALSDVTIDQEARSARVGAGALWQDIVPQASELGLAALHGSAPDICVSGYSLGGGMGWYARKHGLASNSVTAIELVTADGRQLRVDRDNEPELFWAQRGGGGGNFGVVTALEFDLYPIPEVYAGILFFPFERASEVLHAWREWTEGVPDEVTSVGRLLQFPPLEDIPEPVRGQAFAVVEAVCMMSEEEASELLRPLRDLGAAMDTFATMPPAGIAGLHMDPPEPVPYLSAHELLGDFPAKGIDDMLAVTGPGSGSPLLSVELRHLGGALARSEPDHGALASLPASFAAFAVGMAPDEQVAGMLAGHLTKFSEALAPYASGRFLSFVEVTFDLRTVFDAETYGRLAAVRAQYDPEDVFRANHAIKLAA